MKVPLTNVEPLAEIMAMLKEANPGLDTTTISAYKLTAGTTRNSKLYLIGSTAAGIAGRLTVDYDRLNPAAVFSKFGDLTKNRALQLYGVPGTVMKISDVLRQVNDLLGVQLTMTGQFRDIIDGTFTLPAKNASIVVDIMPFVSATGELPINLRIMPSTKLSLSVRGGGALLAGLNKGLNPFAKADGNINWTLSPRPIGDMTPSRDLLLYQQDFTEFFGNTGLIRSCTNGAAGVGLARGLFGYTFNDELVDKLNTIFSKAGVQPLVKGQIHFAHKSGNISLLDVSGTVGNGRGPVWGAKGFFVTTSEYTRVDPPNFNPAFSRVFKVIPPGYPAGTSPDDREPADLLPESQRLIYLNFNIL